MFEASFLVEDKNVASILHALTGLTVGDPTILPVRGAVVKKGVPRAINNGEPIFLTWWRSVVRKGLIEVDTTQIKSGMLTLGATPTYHKMAIKQLRHKGLLGEPFPPGKSREPRTYKILNPQGE